jgi:hypothetical protein
LPESQAASPAQQAPPLCGGAQARLCFSAARIARRAPAPSAKQLYFYFLEPARAKHSLAHVLLKRTVFYQLVLLANFC